MNRQPPVVSSQTQLKTHSACHALVPPSKILAIGSSFFPFGARTPSSSSRSLPLAELFARGSGVSDPAMECVRLRLRVPLVPVLGEAGRRDCDGRLVGAGRRGALDGLFGELSSWIQREWRLHSLSLIWCRRAWWI